MRLIDRYIFREIFSYALLGLAVFTFVFFVPQLARLMEPLVRHSASAGTIALLILCTLPNVFTFTVPMAVLVGVLIGLGRLSADSELIALEAVGMDRKRLLVPVGALALATTALTLVMTISLGPLALGKFRSIEDELLTSQASLQVQPRIFDERFPNLVLYVQDVEAAATRWRGIFLAQTGARMGSRLTFAEEAIVIPEPQQGKLQLHLRHGTSHEYDRSEPDRYSVSTFGESDLPVAVVEFGQRRSTSPTPAEASLEKLAMASGPAWRESRVELHRRFAFPAACLVFALLAVPLGVRPHRGGRAFGFIVTLLMICSYYLLFVTGAGLARRGALSPVLGMWTANLIAGAVGLALLPGMNRIRGDGQIARLTEGALTWMARRLPRAKNGASSRPATPAASRLRHSFGFPLLLDVYLLRPFVYYFGLFLIAFLFLFHSFTFFELLEDIGRHRIPASVVLSYFFYLSPDMVYQFLPGAALVGALVTIGVLSKNNEVTALKASGVSLYRLAMPLLAGGVLLGVGMFVLDDAVLPEANQRQDALRNQIKGRPAQTFFQPRRQWIFGEGSKLYNYALFDPDRSLFGGLHVFELDPATFQLRRRVFASRARWEEHMKTWVLEEGWVRDFDGDAVVRYVPFQVYSLTELTEPPSYFNREVRAYYQLNWYELDRYIQELRQAGFDVARLSVQWHKKFAFPLITPVIILLAVPFAFLFGTRGAVGGLALGVGIGILYWAVSHLFEAVGAVGQLPPVLAGWAPTGIFGFLGLYFFLKMRT